MTPDERLAEFLLKDSNDRSKFQHQFSIEGFKALILINGGAIIGLLTYAGHSSNSDIAPKLFAAFIWYVIGLVVATVAYITAYFSQANFMQDAVMRAYERLGYSTEESPRSADDYRVIGNVMTAVSVLLCVLSVGSFVVGSVYAMRALS